MRTIFKKRDDIEIWRDSLLPGDPVCIQLNDGLQWLTAYVSSNYGTYFTLVAFPAEGVQLRFLRYRDHVYPTADDIQIPTVEGFNNKKIAGALQGCNSGRTRPTAKRHVDHSNREAARWWKRLTSGARYFFSSFGKRLPTPDPMIEPGGSPRERYEKNP